MLWVRIFFFLVGLVILSYGISLTIKVQHLGIHPWDVLSVGLFNQFGLTVGTWNLIISGVLILITLFIDKSYIKIGTFLNALISSVFVDLFLFSGFLPTATNSWIDFIIITAGIVIMGIGGGMYSSVGMGAGPRDGFMLSLSSKTGSSIRKVRIITETCILIIGWLIGGPIFIFTFVFTFIQSPIFQFVFLSLTKHLSKLQLKNSVHKSEVKKMNKKNK